jgi:hypothetical protein
MRSRIVVSVLLNVRILVDIECSIGSEGRQGPSGGTINRRIQHGFEFI